MSKTVAKRGKKKAAAEPIEADKAAGSAAGEHKQLVQKVNMIPLNSIRPCAYNRVLSDDDPRLEGLACSIDQYGMTSPITVRQLGPDEDVPPVYEIIDGERRWRACRKLGIAFISAIVFDVDERAAHALRLVANRERQDLTFLEEGVYRRGRRHLSGVGEARRRRDTVPEGAGPAGIGGGIAGGPGEA